MFDDRPFTFDRTVRLALTGLSLVLAIFTVRYLSDVLLPFAVALVLAYMLDPLVDFVQRLLKSRVASVIVTLLGFALVLALILLYLIPAVSREVSTTAQLFADLIGDTDLSTRLANHLPPEVLKWLKGVAARNKLKDILLSENMFSAAEQGLKQILPGIWKLITGTANVFLAVFGLAFLLLYLVFMLIEFDDIAARWIRYVPPDWREPTQDFLHEFSLSMNNYFRAQAFIAMCMGILCALGFWMIGIPLGIVLGLTAGLFSMVPYLQLVTVPPALLLGFAHSLQTDQSFLLVAGLIIVVYLAAQILQDWILVPRIMHDVTGLSPVIVILSLSVWGKLMGLLGLILAIPLTCLILVYYRRFLASQLRNNRAMPEEPAPPPELPLESEPLPKAPADTEPKPGSEA